MLGTTWPQLGLDGHGRQSPSLASRVLGLEGKELGLGGGGLGLEGKELGFRG